MFCEETLYLVALRHCPLIGDMIFRRLAGEPVRLRKCVKFQSQDFILFIASAKKYHTKSVSANICYLLKKKSIFAKIITSKLISGTLVICQSNS